ncbi:MAG: hypothetical protein KF752_15390 [Pirellulaceae bacterium]|nr:hypothetical protein [Pirellulaceae bacterium]
MSNKSRSDRILLLHKVLGKHFTPVLAPSDRSVLEHLMYACCLQDASYEAADEAFLRLQEAFFDWNEVRVTTITELMEHVHRLPDPRSAATRVKQYLQSIFETRYNFDLQDMIKMNQGKAIAELEKLSGMTRFVLAYVTQNALGGHSIPVDNNAFKVLHMVEIVSDSELAKQQVPGLDRTISKSKGAEFGSVLHQMGVLLAQAPGGKLTKAILKESGAPEGKKAAAAEAKKPVSSDKPSKTVKDASPTLPGKSASGKAASGKAATDKLAAKSDSKKSESKVGGKSATSSKDKTPAAAKKQPLKKDPSKKAAPKSTAGEKTAGKKLPANKPPAKVSLSKRKPK